MASKKISISGVDLSTDEVIALIEDEEVKIALSPETLGVTKKSQDLLERVAGEKIIYGVNTGFGPMVSHLIGRDSLQSLQENIIRSHAVGMGEPVKPEYTLAAMLVRLNTLSRGRSGVSPELLKQLETLINERIIPVIPEHGAVGTSGDLVQLAHIALALIGEGEVFYQGKRRPTKEVFQELNLPSYRPKIKEGLALLNGTSFMSGVACLLVSQAERLISLIIRNGALALEAIHGFNDSFSEELNEVRPHSGQVEIARILRSILGRSELLRDRESFHKKYELNHEVYEIKENGQEVYSLRCQPQILGPILETFQRVKRVVEIEINSVTDNPIIDLRTEKFLHGGNFHGDYVATAMDHLKLAITKLSILSERRLNFFLHQKVNQTFPPFLNLKQPGLTLGLQGLQFVATSTVADNQTLAYPHSLHSIPTNGDNQDVVSMGADAALFAAKVIDNAFIVLAIELIALGQAINFLKEEEKLSPESRKLFSKLRQIFPVVMEDRVLVNELPKVLSWLKNDPELILPLGQ